MPLRLVTAPVQPFGLSEVQDHLRDDGLEILTSIGYGMAALSYCQEVTRRAITTQTLELVLDAFPRTAINVPLPPLQAVDSISYINPDGQTQTLDPQTYDVDTVGGRVAPAYGEAFPATRTVQNAVTVRFTAGYTSVPEPIRAAMLLIIGDLYANREGQQDVRLYGNDTVERLLWPYRWL